MLKDPSQSEGFVFMAIYVEKGSGYTLHIHYGNETEYKLYNIRATLSEEQFLYFDQCSSVHSLENDEVSNRLKASARIYKQGRFENEGDSSSNNTQNNVTMLAGLATEMRCLQLT